MLVREAKERAREWVREVGRETPGFFGAYIHGSANWMDEDAVYPATSDLDIMVVRDRADETIKIGKFNYAGALLEVSYSPVATFRPPEAVL